MIYITMAKDKKSKEKILIQSDYPTKKNFIEDLRKKRRNIQKNVEYNK